ncbi:hypothetical protein CEXT_209911 [Caerostris extrusa]|uniref:Uncharacterized protein n=1 Tax=Caerostris extrusa TaxID=172846 RepID=A0AAV4WWH0_CAEEX|nr:hypothetical protein CEXT_209911 [Caerostris extrusa]
MNQNTTAAAAPAATQTIRLQPIVNQNTSSESTYAAMGTSTTASAILRHAECYNESIDGSDAFSNRLF